MTEKPRTTSITEEDLKAIDTQSVLDEPLAATDKVNALFLQIGTWMAVITTIGIGGLMLVNVLFRYVFSSSLPLASEGPTYFFGWLIAGGAIVAQSQAGHVAVDLIPNLLRPTARKTLEIVIWVGSTLLLAYGAYLGFYLTGVLADQKTLVMEWPTLGSFSSFIVMMALMAVQALIRAILIIRTPASAVDTVASAEAPTVDDSAQKKGDRDV